MKNNDTFKKYVVPVIVLVAICFFISAALALTFGVADPIIKRNTKAEADAARKELLTKADGFDQYKGKLIATSDGKVTVNDVYIAKNGEGMVMTVGTKSFGGTLIEMIGIDKNGKITGVKIQDHKDTPGVGTKELYNKRQSGTCTLARLMYRSCNKFKGYLRTWTGCIILSSNDPLKHRYLTSTLDNSC